jgi:hypothetical protein
MALRTNYFISTCKKTKILKKQKLYNSLLNNIKQLGIIIFQKQVDYCCFLTKMFLHTRDQSQIWERAKPQEKQLILYGCQKTAKTWHHSIRQSPPSIQIYDAGVYDLLEIKM